MNDYVFEEILSTSSNEANSHILNRIFTIIALAAASDRPLTIGEITRHLNIPKATAHRTCKILQDYDLLWRDPFSKGLYPGIRLQNIALDTVLSSSYTSARRAILDSVVKSCGETCTLTVQDGDQLLFLERVESASPVQVQLKSGSRVPLHCTAGGKLFLAFMRPPSREKLLQHLDLVALTSNTITDRKILSLQLKNVRKQKYATDFEEFSSSLIGIAVPVLDEHNRIKASVSVNAPSHRVPREGLEHWLLPLRQAAADLARLIDPATPNFETSDKT